MRTTDSGSTVATSIRLPADLHKKIKDIGVQEDLSMSEVLIIVARLGLYDLDHNYKGRIWEARGVTVSRVRTGETH